MAVRPELSVHVVGRGEQRCRDVAHDHPQLHVHRADGGDRAAIASVAEQVGRVDMLVVTLSGSEGPGPFADLDLDMLRRAFDAKSGRT